MGDLKQELIAKTTGLNKKPEENIGDVKKLADNMGVMNETMGAARKLAGTDTLSQELDRKEKKVEDLGKEKDKVTQDLQDARLQIIQTQLGSKIDQLSETVKSGGSAKSIGEQIAEIKSVAGDLGLGTSKVSEFKDMANLIQSLNPHKDLAQQIKEAKDILSVLQPEKGKEAHIEGVPAEIAVQLKKMDTDFQLKIEEMKDARQKSDQDFQITVKRWEEERDIRRQEVDGKILVERERNQLFSGALKTVGGAIGQGLAASPGSINQGQQSTAKNYQFQVPEGEGGTSECPNCHAPIGIGPTTTLAQCVNCNGQFKVARTPVEKVAETPLAEEEE